jgi:hypothetical protein
MATMGSDGDKSVLFPRLREIIVFGRDCAVTIVIVACILRPTFIKEFLNESGLSELGIFGLSVKLKEVSEKVALAQDRVNEQASLQTTGLTGDSLPEAANSPVDPAFKITILNAGRLAPEILPSAGWVFLGRVNEEKNKWYDDVSITVTSSWPVQVTDTVTVKDDVYVRAITSDSRHSMARITTVAKVGDRLKVVALEYSHARSGGFFVWAKTALLSN